VIGPAISARTQLEWPRPNSAAVRGPVMLVVLLVLGAVSVDGFLTTTNVRSMLLLAAFLGLASAGQTLCALAGGVDLAIPFVIGAANISFLYLLGKGIPSPVAVALILGVGLAVGALNGLLSVLIPAQSVVVTLGVGFTVVGSTQIMTSVGSQYGGVTVGTVPPWLTNVSSLNGTTFGVAVPPVVLLWLFVAGVILVVLHKTWFGSRAVRNGRQPVCCRAYARVHSS
jgi:ribose transport system permease protein